ncbi:molybdenum cofactor guanylyltransferase [Agromyces sp. MMS24-JH15]|uniref:molybdenum cofactor guanylyltransferase n=1 Tax=Agromyces sp. MMS24-JH15 TaxID=3243765 RepID=UPI00374A9858
MTVAFDAVLLAGGRASRYEGRDKTALELDGRSLLAIAVDAVAEARAVAVVGERSEHPGGAHDAPRIRPAVEEPRWAGPVAAILAGLRVLADDPAPFTFVLAADQPFAREAVARLAARLADPGAEGGVVAADASGRRQPLLAAYPTSALRDAVETADDAARGNPRGPSLRAALATLDPVELILPDPLCADVDTAADAARLGLREPWKANA